MAQPPRRHRCHSRRRTGTLPSGRSSFARSRWAPASLEQLESSRDSSAASGPSRHSHCRTMRMLEGRPRGMACQLSSCHDCASTVGLRGQSWRAVAARTTRWGRRRGRQRDMAMVQPRVLQPTTYSHRRGGRPFAMRGASTCTAMQLPTKRQRNLPLGGGKRGHRTRAFAASPGGSASMVRRQAGSTRSQTGESPIYATDRDHGCRSAVIRRACRRRRAVACAVS